ncbi:MAG TPA: hypothetical protein DD477_10225 [Spirochaetaceae bacterium]|nr:hypothetical protein [Spirochaetaceae bacterium]HAW85574.1 hypothetical protein [Spirochaetaceae bacterium]HAX38030.1 hypothetical protein [Spirochaetaceae bacterium]HBO41576.1 hypothetical protein [Spirochaetaceae bacterium]HCQ86813.1 hypothetical protein [Spirochaetaceae bacterium]
MDFVISNPQYIIDAKGHKTGIILSVDVYKGVLEDLSDLAAVAERRDEENISHNVLLSTLRANDLI